MNTEEYLNSVTITEWSQWYLPYRSLKQLLQDLADSIPELTELTHNSSFKKRGLTTSGKGTNYVASSVVGGASFVSPGGGSSTESLGLYVKVQLTSDFELLMEHVEYRVGSVWKKRDIRQRTKEDYVEKRRRMKEHVSPGRRIEVKAVDFPRHEDATREPFPPEEKPASSRHSSAPTTPMSQVSFIFGDAQTLGSGGAEAEHPEDLNSSFASSSGGSGTAARDALTLIRVEHIIAMIREMNRRLMAEVKMEVDRVASFYKLQAGVVSAAAGAVIDRSKMYNKLNKKEQQQVDTTFRQVVYSLNMIQQFCDHNYFTLGNLFTKIHEVTRQDIDLKGHLESVPFFMLPNAGPAHMLREYCIAEFAKNCCDSKVDLAHRRLSMRNEGAETEVTWLQIFWLGVMLGSTVALIFACFLKYWSYLGKYMNDVDYLQTDTYIISFTGILVWMAFLFPINTIIWETFNVNYVFSLHLHPIKRWTPVSLLRDNSIYAMVWVLCLYGFLYSAEEEVRIEHEFHALVGEQTALKALQNSSINLAISDGRIAPGNFSFSDMAYFGDSDIRSRFIEYRRSTFNSWLWPYLFFPICALVFGVQTYLHRKRSAWFLKTLGRIICTPLFNVEFPDFFICEQLISLDTTLFEIQFIFCMFHADSVKDTCDYGRGNWIYPLVVLPSLWRVLQSLRRYHDEPFARAFYPHLVCALKYSVSCLKYTAYFFYTMSNHNDYSDTIVIICLVFYIVLASIDTCFKLWYETWIEFGVLKRNARFFLLRDELLYPRWSYYVAVPCNVGMRFFWILHLLCKKKWAKDEGWVFPVFAGLEIFRRFVWNTYRVETDQVDNTEHYKAVRFAPHLHQVAAHAAWEVSIDDLEREGTSVQEMSSITEFFKLLPRGERIEILRGVLPAEALSAYDTAASPNTDTFTMVESEADFGNGVEMTESFPQQSPKRRGSQAERIQFFQGDDGKLRTAVKMFSELHEEDKVRAVLLRLGDRTMDQYVSSLLATQQINKDHPLLELHKLKHHQKASGSADDVVYPDVPDVGGVPMPAPVARRNSTVVSPPSQQLSPF